MTIGDRIKAVRKAEDLTLEQFAERIKIKPASVSRLERGVNNPADRTLALICSEFNVSEEWLRTGNGPMKEEKARDAVLAAQLDRILTAGPDDFRRRMISVLVQMPSDWWDALEEKAREIVPGLPPAAQLDGERESREKGTAPSISGSGNSDTA